MERISASDCHLNRYPKSDHHGLDRIDDDDRFIVREAERQEFMVHMVSIADKG